MDGRPGVIHPETRGTIHLENAEVLSQERFPANQFVLRVRAPGCAVRAVPGSFTHLSCDEAIPMRRPLSIMRANPAEGWLDFLYKPVGRGLEVLGQRICGEYVSVLGPIGNGFTPDPTRPQVIAIGGGVGIPPMVFLAEQLKDDPRFQVLVLMGSEVPFPFRLASARIQVPHMPAAASSSVELLQSWGVPSRLATNAGYEGCFAGFVTDLARTRLQSLSAEELDLVQIFGCGPTGMLAATADLARQFDVPCQLALEEYMACAVGGCAGCTVLLSTPDGPAMKRVCVDGPVFDAYQVYPG